MEWLSGKKTFIAATGLVIAAVVAFLTGEATLSQAITTALEACGLAALRAGVSKVAP